MEQEKNKIFKKGALKAILFSVVLLLLGEALLGWQYNRLEQKRIPELEQKIAIQNLEIQEQKAEDALRLFLDARINNEENKILRYLTERAMFDSEQGDFELFGNLGDYEIQNKESIGENEFRFMVQVFSKTDRLLQLELIGVNEILGKYYIDSLQLAG